MSRKKKSYVYFLPLIRRQIPKEGRPADPPTINASNYLGAHLCQGFLKGLTHNPKPIFGETKKILELKACASNMKAGLQNLWNRFLIEPLIR